MRLIDADALMKRVCEKECGPHFNIDLCDIEDDSTDTRCVFREYVRSEPTIEPEVRHGRWNDKPDEYCEANIIRHCGARMDGKPESEVQDDE